MEAYGLIVTRASNERLVFFNGSALSSSLEDIADTPADWPLIDVAGVFPLDLSLYAVGKGTFPRVKVYRVSDKNWVYVDDLALPSLGTSTVYQPAFSPDGKLLVVLNNTLPRIHVLSMETNTLTEAQPLSLPNTPTKAHFSPDGSVLVVGWLTTSPRCRFISTVTLETLATPTIAGSVYDARFSPDGTMVAFAHVSSPTLSVRTYPGLETVTTGFSASTAGYSCDWSPDGRYLAFCRNGLTNPVILDAHNAWAQVSVDTLSVASHSCRFSPDGKYLAVSYRGSAGSLVRLRIYRVSDWEVVVEDIDTSTNSTDISWLPRSTIRLSGGVTYDADSMPASYPLRFFNRATGQLLLEKQSGVDGSHMTAFISDNADPVTRIVLHDSAVDPVCNDIIDTVVPD